MVNIPKENTKCKDCVWSTCTHEDCVLKRGYVCKRNPFKKIVMGFDGTHADRKKHIEEEKKKNAKKGSE